MAVLAIFTGKGINAASYELLRKEVNWEGNPPAGGLFHVAGLDANGDVRVADVWESQEALEAFFATRLGPAFAKLGLPAPAGEFFAVHNVNAYAALERYRVG